ncbi:MAG: glycosyltransferase family 4 protein [Planctomycetota bacterium]
MTALVGFDAREAFRENPRGIGLYCRHLLREYGRITHDFHLLAYHERPTPPDLPPLPPCVTPKLTTMRGGRFYFWERLRMPLQMRRDRLDLYHGSYNTLPPRMTRWRAVPMVVTLHDVIVTTSEEDLEDPYVKYCRAATGRIVREAAMVLTVSQWSKERICERYGVPHEKIEIFRNGIHSDFFREWPAQAGEAARQRYAAGRSYLYTIGSPQRRKNMHGLFQALGILARTKRLDHALVVSGVWGEARELLAGLAAREGLEGRVFLHGYVSREELIGLYRGASLTVYPSHAEGFGIPIVESLALGTPVATSRTSAMPEAGGDFADYFDPASPANMAEVIAASIENAPSFAARRDAARARARSFTWQAAAEKTLEVYRRVLA